MTTATIHNVTEGTKIVVRGNFTCMDAGAIVTVERSKAGDLFVACEEGRHYLDGSLGNGEVYVGFSLAEQAKAA